MISFWWENIIKRITMIGKTQNGGLSMVDLESYVMAVKAAWILRLITVKYNWRAIPVHPLKTSEYASLT